MPTISFNTIQGVSLGGAMQGRFRMAGRMYGLDVGDGVMDGGFLVRGAMLASQSGDAANDEASAGLPASMAGMLVLAGSMAGTSSTYGEAVGRFVMSGDLVGLGMTLLQGSFLLSGEVVELPESINYGVAVDGYPEVMGYGGIQFHTVIESVVGAAGSTTLPTLVVESLMQLGSPARGSALAASRVQDDVLFGDHLAVVFQQLSDEGVVFSSLPTVTYVMVGRVVEQLLLQGAASSYGDAVETIVAALVFGAAMEALSHEASVDTIALSALVADLYTAAEQQIEALILAAGANPSHTAMTLVSESVQLGAALAGSAEFAQAVVEGVGFAAHLTLDSGEYVAWVMNTESHGTTTYANYPFNSFARVGGVYYGACSTGLRRLEGNDDTGDKIQARIRIGLSALGTRLLKRVPDAFIGYTSDGTLLLRVITVGEATGEKEASTYKLAPRPASVVRENRFQIGRGLKSVDWDFEIENVDGADFDIASIEFRPLVLSRRTRG